MNNDQNDPLAAETPPADDPFADVPSDALGDEPLPPGVQPGSLGGENPSEEEPPAEEGEITPPQSEEEYLQEPPEAMPEEEEPLFGEEPPPAEPEPEPAPDPEPAPPEEPQSDPLAGEPEPPPEEAKEKNGADHEPEPDPGTPVEPSVDSPPEGGNPTEAEDPPKLEEPPAPPEPEPPKAEAKAKPKKRKRKSGKSKSKSNGGSKVGPREYVILSLASAPDATTPTWAEAFPREIPHGQDGSEPHTISARSGELALRAAYRLLSENSEGSFELVPVPAKLFKPRPVVGRVPEQALAIKIG